jgi:hypothetical protein
VETDWDHKLYEYHRQLIQLRHACPALRTGDYRVIYAQGTSYVFARCLDAEEIVVAVNVGTAPTSVPLDCSKTQLQSKPNKLLFGAGAIQGEGDKLGLSLPARSGCIWAEV